MPLFGIRLDRCLDQRPSPSGSWLFASTPGLFVGCPPPDPIKSRLGYGGLMGDEIRTNQMILARIARLERQNLMLKRGALAVLVAVSALFVVSLGLMGQATTTPTATAQKKTPAPKAAKPVPAPAPAPPP